MSSLKDFLFNQDIGVTSTGDELHIIVSLAEHLIAVADALDVITPTISLTAVPTIGVATIAGVSLAVTGPVLGLAGVFMALGSGYEAAREEIQNEAVASGFSQGFVAGLLNMSAGTVRSLFAQQGVISRHPMDPEADILEMKARNRGVVAGYAMANQAGPDDKKAYLSELRAFTGPLSAGDWTDRDKIDYVITNAAQLRLHFLQDDPEASDRPIETV
jgi:hypothetical protein